MGRAVGGSAIVGGIFYSLQKIIQYIFDNGSGGTRSRLIRMIRNLPVAIPIMMTAMAPWSEL
jgi:hypothetical protein